MTGVRSMPTARTIRFVWAMRLVELGKADSVQQVIDARHDWCFHCGINHKVPGGLERAHILARMDGGSDTPDNLHLLCHQCHVHSELLDGDAYWEWFKQNGWRRLLHETGIDHAMAGWTQ